MGGKTTDVGNPSDYKFMDPTGGFNQSLGQFESQYRTLQDPNAYMNAFMNQQAGLANIAQGATAPLSQSLAANASDMARRGGEEALARMPGGRFSGAGMAAYGDAYAQPFAQAAAQAQAAQLGLTGNLWNNALGSTAQGYQNALNLAGQNYGNLAGQTSAWYQPTYQYQPGFGDYLMQGLGVGAQALGAMTGAGFFSGRPNAEPALNRTTQQPLSAANRQWG